MSSDPIPLIPRKYDFNNGGYNKERVNNQKKDSAVTKIYKARSNSDFTRGGVSPARSKLQIRTKSQEVLIQKNYFDYDNEEQINNTKKDSVVTEIDKAVYDSDCTNEDFVPAPVSEGRSSSPTRPQQGRGALTPQEKATRKREAFMSGCISRFKEYSANLNWNETYKTFEKALDEIEGKSDIVPKNDEIEGKSDIVPKDYINEVLEMDAFCQLIIEKGLRDRSLSARITRKFENFLASHFGYRTKAVKIHERCQAFIEKHQLKQALTDKRDHVKLKQTLIKRPLTVIDEHHKVVVELDELDKNQNAKLEAEIAKLEAEIDKLEDEIDDPGRQTKLAKETIRLGKEIDYLKAVIFEIEEILESPYKNWSKELQLTSKQEQILISSAYGDMTEEQVSKGNEFLLQQLRKSNLQLAKLLEEQKVVIFEIEEIKMEKIVGFRYTNRSKEQSLTPKQEQILISSACGDITKEQVSKGKESLSQQVRKSNLQLAQLLEEQKKRQEFKKDQKFKERQINRRPFLIVIARLMSLKAEEENKIKFLDMDGNLLIARPSSEGGDCFVIDEECFEEKLCGVDGERLPHLSIYRGAHLVRNKIKEKEEKEVLIVKEMLFLLEGPPFDFLDPPNLLDPPAPITLHRFVEDRNTQIGPSPYYDIKPNPLCVMSHIRISSVLKQQPSIDHVSDSKKLRGSQKLIEIDSEDVDKAKNDLHQGDNFSDFLVSVEENDPILERVNDEPDEPFRVDEVNVEVSLSSDPNLFDNDDSQPFSQPVFPADEFKPSDSSVGEANSIALSKNNLQTEEDDVDTRSEEYSDFDSDSDDWAEQELDKKIEKLELLTPAPENLHEVPENKKVDPIASSFVFNMFVRFLNLFATPAVSKLFVDPTIPNKNLHSEKNENGGSESEEYFDTNDTEWTPENDQEVENALEKSKNIAQ